MTAQVYPTLSYDYDNNGNITKVYENGVEKERYTYDSLNRLTRQENVKLNRIYVMEYDINGDILSKKTYNLTTGALLNEMQYEYNNTTWKNAFSKINNQSATYDANGNLTSYNDCTYTWDKGSRLSEFENYVPITFEYDQNGLLYKKDFMSMETTYFYSGTTLVSMDVYGEVLNFTYDAEGKPFSMSYDGGLYYYILNL